jgi:hypothetical protein
MIIAGIGEMTRWGVIFFGFVLMESYFQGVKVMPGYGLRGGIKTFKK